MVMVWSVSSWWWNVIFHCWIDYHITRSILCSDCQSQQQQQQQQQLLLFLGIQYTNRSLSLSFSLPIDRYSHQTFFGLPSFDVLYRLRRVSTATTAASCTLSRVPLRPVKVSRETSLTLTLGLLVTSITERRPWHKPLPRSSPNGVGPRACPTKTLIGHQKRRHGRLPSIQRTLSTKLRIVIMVTLIGESCEYYRP